MGHDAPVATALVDVSQAAEMCCCSTRTIRRLSDAGLMPRPVKIGALVRWRQQQLLDWIEDGCQSVRRSPANR